jgi:geranylgeranyl pyrophosphate synthase
MMPFIPGVTGSRPGAKQPGRTNGASSGASNGAGTPPTAAAPLFGVIAEDLAAVEQAIQDVAEVKTPLLKQTLRLILSAGGKRVRPALTILAARLHENTLKRRVELAVASELLHTASLAHDDVLDISDARRGKPTINSQFNNTLAVLTGDYLFGRSGALVAGLDDPRIMGVYSRAVMELVEGEILRPSVNGDLAQTERDYLAKIRGKTASLFAMSCETGAMLDSQDGDLVQRMHDYGMNLGMAFQIADDVLDYTATEEQLGKPVGSDLRHGTVTLPAINFLNRHPDHPIVRGLLTHDEDALARADEAVDAIRGSGATDEARSRAREYSALAVRSLDGLGSSPVLEAMRRLATYVVDRQE